MDHSMIFTRAVKFSLFLFLNTILAIFVSELGLNSFWRVAILLTSQIIIIPFSIHQSETNSEDKNKLVFILFFSFLLIILFLFSISDLLSYMEGLNES